MNAHAEYHDAMAADDAWQDALDAAKIDRYTLAARGIEGSELRRLYEAKVIADNVRFTASASMATITAILKRDRPVR